MYIGRLPGDKQNIKRGKDEENHYVDDGMVMMFVSLGGCFWGYEGHDGRGAMTGTEDTTTGVKGMTGEETTEIAIRNEG